MENKLLFSRVVFLYKDATDILSKTTLYLQGITTEV